ncbi:hypothetical protein, partial [Crocosphaera sp. Alani8]|uniref:hypothetical protein n=1 Tax=Crocosphaera sp. Alani8 TaxID=3038952 RepID=UPI00313E574F
MMAQTTENLQVPTAKRNGKKIQGKFYPLQHEEYLTIRSKLKPNQLDIYLYLITKHPFKDCKLEIDTSLISEQLGYHRRTVQSAIKKLVSLNLLEVEITKFKYRQARYRHQSKQSNESVDRPHCNTKVIRESVDRLSESTDRLNESTDRLSESTDRLNESTDRQQPLEPAPSADRRTPQTIQTFETLQTGVGVENSPPTESELINKESDEVQQDSYSEVATVREEEIVDLKDPREEDSSADVAQITTKRVTMTVNSHSLPVTSEEHLTATDEVFLEDKNLYNTRHTCT